MTRWLLALACLGLVATSTQARRVVHIPTIRELCPGNDDWAKVAQCLARHGTVKLLRDDADVKLVRMAGTSRLAGLALYRHTKTWQLHGELRLYEEHELLGFERARFGTKTAFRADIGLAVEADFNVDGEVSVPGVIRQKLTWLCLEGAGCTQVITACDGLVHGKALYSFRGKLVYQGRELKVVGDRRNAGPFCAQSELVFSFD